MQSSLIGDACTTAAFGLDLCAARTTDPRVKVAVESAATNLRALSQAAESGRKSRLLLRDRLRWEWVASTGASLEGSAESRLLAECASILGAAVRSLSVLESSGDNPLALRLRVASAEAWSLAQCVAPVRTRSLEAFA